MLTSPEIWRSQLQSSKFHYNLNPYNDEVRLGFKVDVYTRSLTYFELDSEREQRLRLISDLSDQGCSNLQISQFFNLLELKTPRGTVILPFLTEVKVEVKQPSVVVSHC